MSWSRCLSSMYERQSALSLSCRIYTPSIVVHSSTTRVQHQTFQISRICGRAVAWRVKHSHVDVQILRCIVL